MSNRPARITQAEIERIIRAGKKAGLNAVMIKIGDQAWASFPLSGNATVDLNGCAWSESRDSRWED
jgi:hypothetical protein